MSSEEEDKIPELVPVEKNLPTVEQNYEVSSKTQSEPSESESEEATTITTKVNTTIKKGRKKFGELDIPDNF